MTAKLVLLPLDERPCNLRFPGRLFAHDGVELRCPDRLGDKKNPADGAALAAFLREACRDADGLVLSLDMLLYGGLIPSRLHHRKPEQLLALAQTVRELKRENPKLLIYAFQCIMRCPNYSSSDEEPDYYEQYGAAIHRAGELLHKSSLGLCDAAEYESAARELDPAALRDYTDRRACNRAMNLALLEYVREGWIDALVIPQDDSAAYGYSAMDQQAVRAAIAEQGLQDRVLMYPGADEVSLTLVSRMLNRLAEKKPKVYVKYAAEGAKSVLPIYEGNSLDTTVRFQLLSAGCQLTDSYERADFILAVTAPAERIEEAIHQPSQARGYCVERCMPELLDFADERVREGRAVIFADNAYGNGGELQLLAMLDRAGLLDRVAGYAGWNTSANTLGTAIAQGVDYFHQGRTPPHMNFLMERYLEDCGYCSVVRKKVAETLARQGMNYFDIKESDGAICGQVREELLAFQRTALSSLAGRVTLGRVWMPWRRMFEVGLEAEYEGRD